MENKKKTVPEQFGQMALGFAELIRRIDDEKAKKAIEQATVELFTKNNMKKS